MRSNCAWMNSISRAQVLQPLGDGATMTALRPFSALMILLAGVAAGLVEGVMAQTTPTGRAISMMPLRRILGDHADRLRALQVAQQAEGLAVVLAHLVGDVADAGVGHGQLGQLAVARRLDDRPAGGGDQLVDPRLVVALGDALRGARARAPVRATMRRVSIAHLIPP